MEQRGIERNSPAEALGNHTVPHSGATCSEGVGDKGASLEGFMDGWPCLPRHAVRLLGVHIWTNVEPLVTPILIYQENLSFVLCRQVVYGAGEGTVALSCSYSVL